MRICFLRLQINREQLQFQVTAMDYYLDGNQKTKNRRYRQVTTYAYDNLGRLSSESMAQSGTTDTISLL